MPRPVIAIDADGVLVDFHHGYADAWHRTFGTRPAERDPEAYWPMDRWQVDRLDDAGRLRFRQSFDDAFWGYLPAIAGALEACHRLHAGGHELVCVSALDLPYEAARLRNLRTLGFPIERVVATGHAEGAKSPKADAIEQLAPVAFVDDYLPYLRGLPPAVHAALVLRAPNGTPNVGPELELADSIHRDLAAFADYWLSR